MAVLLFANTVQAVENSAAQRVEPVYPAEFFASFQPQTAFDMLGRTPGFALAEGAYVRGFGGAAGNVLIDGQRPTVKGGGITDVLQRIPASRVARILLLCDGESVEAQGQVLVANVVLKADTEGSGTATLTLARTFDGNISPAASVSYSQSLGAWQTSIEVSAEVDYYPTAGRFQLRDTSAALVESRVQDIAGRSPEAALAFSATRPLGGGTFTVNGRIGLDQYRSLETLILHPGGFDAPSNGREEIDFSSEEYAAELGADWTRSLAQDWTFKLVGLGRMEHSRNHEDYAAPNYRGISASRQEPAEAIARTTLSREGDHWLRPEIGAEFAWNALTSRLDYKEDLGAGFVPVALTGADTRVTELRGEVFGNLNARLGSGFRAEAGLAFEMSRIEATSGASHTQSLSYLKPSAALIWSAANTTNVRLGIRHTVDQLDFGDFAASVSQTTGRLRGGNAALRPARLTRGYFRLDHRWGQGGALSTELFYQRHEGLLGYILLPSNDQAMGTIGDGMAWGLTALATIPLDSIVPGSQIKLDGTLRRSHVRDIFTGRERRINGLPDSMLTAEFRQDIAAFGSAWGVRYTATKAARVYYIDEELAWDDHPVWTAYVETSAIPGFKSVLTLEGIGGRKEVEMRRFHRPNVPALLTGIESRVQQEGMRVSLSLIRPL